MGASSITGTGSGSSDLRVSYGLNRIDLLNRIEDLEDSSGALTLDVTTISDSTYVAGANSEVVILVNAASNAITINLPIASSNANRHFNIKKIDSSSNTVTIDANGSETIDGETTAEISEQYTSLTLVCDGSNWFII